MSRKRTTEDFVILSTLVHGYKYDYSNSEYTGALNKVTIICENHGEFQQVATNHIRGFGCQKCWINKLGKITLKSKELLLEQFYNIHKDSYDYSKVEYICDKTKIIVCCKSHGDFNISPNNHRKGRGCPSCAKHGYRRNRAGTLYVIQADDLLKVGITNNDVKDRVRRINLSSGNEFKILEKYYFQDGQTAYDLEKLLLKYLSSKYKNPSNIFDGSTETFVNVDLDDFKIVFSNLI